MRVRQLWRYPVKSLQGEQVDATAVTHLGLDGDRRFALFDLRTGLGLTARRVPELLFARAAWHDGAVEITLPDGAAARDDDDLSAWLGRPVALVSCEDQEERVYENPVDFEREDQARWLPFVGSPGAFHDSRRAAVSLVSTATLGAWPAPRFRANVVLDGDGEDGLVGSRVAVGGVHLDVGMRIGRCVMVTRPQPGGIGRDLDVLRTVNRERGGYLAVGALVAAPGVVTVGDDLHLDPPG